MPEPTLDELTERMRELCEKAAPGPWDKIVKMDLAGFTAVGAKVLIANVFSENFRDEATEKANANFISAARTYIPLVIEERQTFLAIINCLKRSVSGSVGMTWVEGAVPTVLIDAAMQKGDLKL